jgi:hypothetical protein
MSSKTTSARPGHDRASLYDKITGKIIAELEAGRAPWVQPWGTAAAKAPLAIPKNAATGRQYSGINVLILWGAVIEHGFPAQSWLTFRQALSLSGNVRKGELGANVVYADRFVPDDEAALAAFDDRRVTYDPADIARAGVFVSIDAEGALSVDRGYVRPEDEAPAGEPEQDGETDPAMAGTNHIDPETPVVQRAVITIGGQVAEPEDEDDEDLKPLPDRLVTELTAERTLALRDKLANTPAVAFQAVLHKFCLDVFSRYFSYGTAMEVSVRSASFPVQAQGLKDTPAAKAIDVRHKAWEERLPKDKADLWVSIGVEKWL